MELSLKNKNAIVCGSTQGIGESSAIELAKLGANITLIARNQSKLLNVLSELDKSQGQVHSFVCIDFSDTGRLTDMGLNDDNAGINGINRAISNAKNVVKRIKNNE